MFTPELKKFNQLTQKGYSVPVAREIPADLETPVTVFLKLKSTGATFLLESVESGKNLGRYSFIGLAPSFTVKVKDDAVIINRGSKESRVELAGSNPLAKIKELLSNYKVALVDENLPGLFAGAVGYMSYDIVRYFENISKTKPQELDLPDALFLFNETMIVFDHVKRKLKVMVLSNGPETYEEVTRRIDDIIKILSETPVRIDGQVSSRQKGDFATGSNFTREEFKEIVLKAKEYIKAGDIFQVVLSQRIKGKTEADPFQIYRALRMLNPSPYMFYFDFGGFNLIGSSPEALVKLEDGIATVRPIAGTRPRGSSEEADIRLEAELMQDEKERAEHIMLVDLGRNDLGRVCEYGTVKVTDLMGVERYSHVMHIVSNVTGKLLDKHDMFSLLAASFPAGTVSGAPKVRAMEIIEKLEPTQRGPYAGAVGYFSLSGNMDMCITIRTIILKDKTYYLQGGAGIVADSDPDREYEETLNKVEALARAIEMAEEGL